jgi:type I restriction enzyme S subunit
VSGLHPIFGTQIPSGWTSLIVDDIKAPVQSACVAGPFGSNIASKYFVPDGVPVIRGGNLTDDLTPFIAKGFVFVSSERAQQYKAQHVAAGDLVFTCWGTVGQVGRIPEDGPFDEYIISNKQLKLRPDLTRVDSRFLFYYFAGPRTVEYIRNRAVGAAVPGINLGTLKGLPVILPPLPTQRKIAAILSVYDDLIENNNRRITLLEEMAQRIYREWFVDFRYPGHEEAPLRESEVGTHPEGWRLRPLGEVLRQVKTTISPSQSPDEEFQHFSIPAFDTGGLAPLERGRSILSNKFLVGEPSVLFSKLNPRIPRVWWAEPKRGARAVASTEFLVLTPAAGWSLSMLYATLLSREFADRVVGMAVGTSTSHQRVKPKDLFRLPVADPPAPLCRRFTQLVEPLFALARTFRRQAQVARHTRDLLLPRLVSGGVDVERLDILVEEPAA